MFCTLSDVPAQTAVNSVTVVTPSCGATMSDTAREYEEIKDEQCTDSLHDLHIASRTALDSKTYYSTLEQEGEQGIALMMANYEVDMPTNVRLHVHISCSVSMYNIIISNCSA